MENTERKVLKGIINGLIELNSSSGLGTGESGDLRDWCRYSKKQRSTINMAISVLESLIEDDSKEKSEDQDDSISISDIL